MVAVLVLLLVVAVGICCDGIITFLLLSLKSIARDPMNRRRERASRWEKKQARHTFLPR